MKPERALENFPGSELTNIFCTFPEIIAVYMFGSYLKNKELARDMDLAVLLKHPADCEVEIYMDLYPRLAQVLSPLEPDLLFLHTASLPVRFEVIATGEVIYSSDDQLRTDFEYLLSGEYLDFKYHLDMIRQELFEAIKEGNPLV